MWPFPKRTGHRPDPHAAESLRLQREALRLAELALRAARKNVYLQALAAVAAILTLLVAWKPWTGSPATPLAQVTLVPPTHDAVVPRAIGDLPAPPAYPAAADQAHCGLWWRTWLIGQQAAEVMVVPTVRISAPAKADVTITDALVHVYSSRKPAQLSYVQCFHAGGPVPGTELDVNLDRPDAQPTIVADDGRDTPLAFPGAVINIDPGHTEPVLISPHGRRRLYAWSIQLRLVVDQHTQTVTLGSARRPLRSWLGPLPAAAYDYDQTTRAWRMISAEWQGPQG